MIGFQGGVDCFRVVVLEQRFDRSLEIAGNFPFHHSRELSLVPMNESFIGWLVPHPIVGQQVFPPSPFQLSSF